MNENQSSSPLMAEEGSITLSAIWKMFWNYKRWYFLSLSIAVLMAAFYLYRTPKIYNSVSQVMIDDSNQAATMKNLGVDFAGMVDFRSSQSIENEVVAFSSPDLMTEVVTRLGLETRYFEKQFMRTVELYKNSPVEMVLAGDNLHSGFSFILEKVGENEVELSEFTFMDHEVETKVKGCVGDTLSTPVGALAFFSTDMFAELDNPLFISWTPSRKAARGFGTNLSVSLSGKESSVIVLSINDTFPSRAEAILNTLLDVYNEVWISNKNRASINTSKFIDDRLVVIENELNVVENSLKEYKETHNLTDLKAVAQTQIEESSRYAEKSFEVANQLSIARYIKDYLIDPANAMALIPSNLGLTQASVDSQISEYNDLLLQRERLLAGSSANNPLVVDLRNALQSLRTAILRSIENLIASLELQEERIANQENQLLSKMSSSTNQEFQILSIERQHKIKQELYVFLLQRREENDMAALINVGNTRVLMNPYTGNVPVSPKTMMILLAAVFLGLGVPFGIIFLIDAVDQRIKSRKDFSNVSVPFLGEIPSFENPDSLLKRCLERLNPVDHKSERHEIIVRAGERDLVNESFRVLRTNVDMMLESGDGKGKVVMFTSFLPNAGKSALILNLAASMALKKSKVLLVDLDLRKGTLGSALKISHSGISSYLSGRTDNDYLSLCDEIAPNLKMLPVGTLPPNPAELLLKDRFKAWLEDVRTRFDYVFVDCPPIEVVADAGIVSRNVDMTVFVLRTNQLDKSILPVLDSFYKNDQYRHMGVILNDVKERHGNYGYGRYGYGYGYGYTHGKKKRK